MGLRNLPFGGRKQAKPVEAAIFAATLESERGVTSAMMALRCMVPHAEVNSKTLTASQKTVGKA